MGWGDILKSEQEDWKIKMGTQVEDIITGYVGRVTARCVYMNGCVQYEVTTELLEGHMLKPVWLDEQRLKLVEADPELEYKDDGVEFEVGNKVSFEDRIGVSHKGVITEIDEITVYVHDGVANEKWEVPKKDVTLIDKDKGDDDDEVYVRDEEQIRRGGPQDEAQWPSTPTGLGSPEDSHEEEGFGMMDGIS